MTKDDGLNVVKWSGRKLYKCRLCAFDSLDRKAFERHFAERHPPLQIIEGGGSTDPLEGMTRDELNRLAADMGIKEVEELPTKADVITAIEAVSKTKEK